MQSRRRPSAGTRHKPARSLYLVKFIENSTTALGVRYHSERLALWMNRKGENYLDVRRHPRDIGAVEVRLGGDWFEVPASDPMLAGVAAQTWLTAWRSIRAAHMSARNSINLAALSASDWHHAACTGWDWTSRGEAGLREAFSLIQARQSPIKHQRNPSRPPARFSARSCSVIESNGASRRSVEATATILSGSTTTPPSGGFFFRLSMVKNHV